MCISRIPFYFIISEQQVFIVKIAYGRFSENVWDVYGNLNVKTILIHQITI